MGAQRNQVTYEKPESDPRQQKSLFLIDEIIGDPSRPPFSL